MSDKNSFSVSAVNSYSQALYEIADENKLLNEIEEQVAALIKLIAKSSLSDRATKQKTVIFKVTFDIKQLVHCHESFIGNLIMSQEP